MLRNPAKKNKIYLVTAVLMLLCIPFWVYYCAPIIKKLPSQFRYHAEILSIDNLYDPAAKKFIGEHISKTHFQYSVVGTSDEVNIILIDFTVKTLNDKLIFSANRFYYIDPYSLKHKSSLDPRKREGFLFGPRYANKTPFQYWHINYNVPANMQFMNTDKINGLTVYHYQAKFNADQTENLTNLPDVPDKYGIITRVTLDTWIEPISGWLVKYQDNALAYYYDIKTKNIISPWNSFSNVYTQRSIDEEVKAAIYKKWHIIIIDVFMPTLLILAALYFLLRYYQYHLVPTVLARPIERALIFLRTYWVYLSVFILAFGFYFLLLNFSENDKNNYLIGIASWQNTNEVNEMINGFKNGLAESGFNSDLNTVFHINTAHASIKEEINIIQKFVKDKVDVIFAINATTALLAKSITYEVPIVFTDVIYPVEFGLVASLRSSGNNLVGTRNYVSAAEQYNRFEKFFPDIKSIAFIHHLGDPDSEIQYQEFKKLLEPRGIQIIPIAAIDVDDLKNKLTAQSKIDAMYVACDSLMQGGGGDDAVIQYTTRFRIPSFSCDASSIRKGIFMGYVLDYFTLGKLAGRKAALILQGIAPTWLRTDTPSSKFLLINNKTRALLNITVPASFQDQSILTTTDGAP